MVADHGIYNSIVCIVRQRKLPHSDRVGDRRDVAHIQCKGESYRADLNDNFQCFIRYDISDLRLLRRNDNISRDDRPHGIVSLDLMAQKPI